MIYPNILGLLNDFTIACTLLHSFSLLPIFIFVFIFRDISHNIHWIIFIYKNFITCFYSAWTLGQDPITVMICVSLSVCMSVCLPLVPRRSLDHKIP